MVGTNRWTGNKLLRGCFRPQVVFGLLGVELLALGIVANLPMEAMAGGPPSNGPVHDPGLRQSVANAGSPLSGLNSAQLLFFQDGLSRFISVDSVAGTMPGEPGLGLGPMYNSNSCGSCHSQPGIGGSSPSVNPQIRAAFDAGARNSIPSFLTPDGPVREARFPYLMNANGTVSKTADGGVHDLFTIEGRADAPGCKLAQPDFDRMVALHNIAYRIPTPVFGSGLIETIPEETIYANMAANASLKQMFGISGHPNLSANDGTVTRFGWKAQNKSVEIFSGEAYNVEMGVTNELFPNERGGAPSTCLYGSTPEDTTNFPASTSSIQQNGIAIPSDTVAFADFMRFLAAPVPSAQGIPGNPTAASLADGRAVFKQIHCDLCHTPAMQTGPSTFAPSLSNQTAALFSDLLVHHMGADLADNIAQGSAGGDEFRTAPLWGLGQRIFFLHDGRATPANGGLLTAIHDHAGQGSEANGVVEKFRQLTDQQQQDLLNYLRSL